VIVLEVSGWREGILMEEVKHDKRRLVFEMETLMTILVMVFVCLGYFNRSVYASMTSA